MPVVDADAHVDETEETWQYIDEPLKRYTPITVTQQIGSEAGAQPKGYNRFWFSDGRFLVRRVRDDVRTRTTLETRELLDVPARMRHLDELGIDLQVCYPTSFLMRWNPTDQIEHALRKSYNRWMGSKWAESDNRMRWVALLPMGNIDEAIRELHTAKENGACGIMQKGIEWGYRSAADPYFYPLYKEAEDLNIPICFHTGTSDPHISDAQALNLSFHNMMAPVIDAFLSLYTAGVPTMFPKLRVGFIEAMASWLPLALAELRAREERSSWLFPNLGVVDNLIKESRFYVACQTVEDLPYLIKTCGEDNLVAGTDYTHADQSAEIETLSIIRRMGDENIITKEQARKILEDNPKAFYGL